MLLLALVYFALLAQALDALTFYEMMRSPDASEANPLVAWLYELHHSAPLLAKLGLVGFITWMYMKLDSTDGEWAIWLVSLFALGAGLFGAYVNML